MRLRDLLPDPWAKLPWCGLFRWKGGVGWRATCPKHGAQGVIKLLKNNLIAEKLVTSIRKMRVAGLTS